MKLMKLDRTVQRCFICESPAAADHVLCSRSCLWQAQRELEENRAILQHPAADPNARASLAARNGYLTSALSRCPLELP